MEDFFDAKKLIDFNLEYENGPFYRLKNVKSGLIVQMKATALMIYRELNHNQMEQI